MEVLMELREVQMAADWSREQVVVLGEVNGNRTFPIYVGHYEAAQLDLALSGEQPPRPLTHDLVINAIRDLGGEVTRVIIDELRPMGLDKVFCAKLAVTTDGGREIRIDSRSSDAIVIATKLGVPVYVDDGVLEQTFGQEGAGP